MTIIEIENNLHTLVANFDKKSFIFDLLLAYDTPKSTIKRLQGSDHDKLETSGELVLHILNEKEKHSQKTLYQLYDPNKMPKGLQKAHHTLDRAIEQCYPNQTRLRAMKNALNICLGYMKRWWVRRGNDNNN